MRQILFWEASFFINLLDLKNINNCTLRKKKTLFLKYRE